MGFSASQWAHRRENTRGLDSTQRLILWAAAWSCIDTTGWLACGRGWIAETCGLSARSLDRHLPQLAKLQLLVPGDAGFRLSAFMTAKLSAKLAEEKESTKEKEVLGFEVLKETPLPPLQGGNPNPEPRISRRERKLMEMGLRVEEPPEPVFTAEQEIELERARERWRREASEEGTLDVRRR